ncbi:BTB/POZ domain-containing protein At3g56230 [Physcomitrium patens]|uniref:BTB domain-containing protein n=1 Tax=Physcomitrium patens TaxID=3218 RepID=A9RQZ2_PHYPA|nr:BTB/POZ domain-containing protein At3g56230-like [Physcomitrium patens]|eukprot:XP_024376160.1 BTB/POZ domain-containing protein At3g56230-like [Physcomitrella patens]
MDCCLCSSVANSYRPPRNTLCKNCYEGAKSIIDLCRKLEQQWRDDEDVERGRQAAPYGLQYAFNQIKQLDQMEENVSEKLEFLGSLIEAFQTGMHTDVELVTNDGLSIHAHRIVMATKSSVFRAIFESDALKEPHTGVVHIPELSHYELRYLLEFMYCAEIPADAMAEHGHALLMAADKYDIPVLSKVCEAFICATVSPSNVLDVLELATLTHATSLKETAINVILDSYEEVVFSKGYEDFASKNALLSVEITKALIKVLKK